MGSQQIKMKKNNNNLNLWKNKWSVLAQVKVYCFM